MAYIPTISTNSTPAVEVTLAGVMDYGEFIASLGTYNYKINEVYISADTMDQLTQRIKYNIFNAAGQQVDNVVVVTPDPYQKQKAIIVDTKCGNLYLNGQSSLSFNLKPNENVVMQLATEMFTMVNGGTATLPSNSNLMNDTLGNMKLFNERYTRFSCDKKKITKVITVYITNNTDSQIYINILNGINSQQPGIVNSTTKYNWDITSETYSHKDSVTLQVKNQDGTYTTYTSPIYPGGIKNPSDVIAALDSIGIGTFYIDEESGQIYIVTDNNTIVYGDLGIIRTIQVPITFSGPLNYVANNSRVMKISAFAGNEYSDPTSFTFHNLPSFVTIESQGIYPFVPVSQLVGYFILSVQPGGVLDNGIYNFSVTANDGFSSITKNYTLTVDATVYPIFDRPYSNPTTRSIAVGDDGQTWLYTAAAPNANSIDQESPYDGWSISIGGGDFRVFPTPLSEQVGQGLMRMTIGRFVLTSGYSDSALLFITVIP